MDIFSYITKQTLVYIAVPAIALVAIGGYVVLGRGNGEEATLTVKFSDFLQEVSVSGKVVAAQDVDLGFSQAGRITRVYVTVGKSVTAGTILAEVENGELRAGVLQRQAALEREKAKLASLKAGTRQEELAVAESDVLGKKEALVNELRKAYTTADDAVRNQLDKFVSNPRGSSPQVSFSGSDSQAISDVQSKRVSIEKTLTNWKIEVDALGLSSDLSGAAAKAQANLTETSSILASAATALNQAIPNSVVTQTLIASYISDIGAARTDVNAVASSLSGAVSALDAAERNLTLKRAGSTPEGLAEQEAQVRSAEADLMSARATLAKTLIAAPFTGIVTVVDAKPGKSVSPNTPEISMIGAGNYQIESFVPEVHVALIKVSDEAAITLDAYGVGVPFPATVISIDPAETVRDGVSTYRAMLEFKENDERLRAGMTANVVITTAKKSNVISIPQGVVAERAGKKFVRVQEGALFVEREVRTGAISSAGDIEILSGLSNGDIVALKKPE